MLFNVLISAVFPPKCLSCGDFFNISISDAMPNPRDANIDEIMRSAVCSECRKDILPASPLQSRLGIFGKVHAAGMYHSVLRTLIHLFKYEDKTGLADAFGKMLFSAFIRYWKAREIDMIVPVPLHISRLKMRGFNQALLMLGNWSGLFGKIGEAPISIEPELLIRIRATKPQVDLGAEERKINLRDAFMIRYPEKIRGRSVLLIDDVYTTGSTVSECAAVMLRQGVRRVDVLTLAKAGDIL